MLWSVLLLPLLIVLYIFMYMATPWIDLLSLWGIPWMRGCISQIYSPSVNCFKEYDSQVTWQTYRACVFRAWWYLCCPGILDCVSLVNKSKYHKSLFSPCCASECFDLTICVVLWQAGSLKLEHVLIFIWYRWIQIFESWYCCISPLSCYFWLFVNCTFLLFQVILSNANINGFKSNQMRYDFKAGFWFLHSHHNFAIVTGRGKILIC